MSPEITGRLEEIRREILCMKSDVDDALRGIAVPDGGDGASALNSRCLVIQQMVRELKEYARARGMNLRPAPRPKAEQRHDSDWIF